MPESLTASTIAPEAMRRELHQQVLGYVARRLRSREDAEDIAQEVMLRIHRHSAELVHVERMSAWVYRIAGNAITDHYRRAARREVPSGHAADVPEPERDTAAWAWMEPDADQLRQQLASCLGPLVERLPASCRHALELTELEGILPLLRDFGLRELAADVQHRIAAATA